MIKKKITSLFVEINSDNFYNLAGNIAERFTNKDSGEYDDLKDRLYYWITVGIKDFK